MSYYLEREKFYWLKFIFDGTLLFSSFFIIYFIKRGNLSIEIPFKRFLLVLFLLWFISTLFSKKFFTKEKQSYFERLRQYVFADLVLIALLTLSMYLLGWYHLSRFIVFGSIGGFFALEIIYTSSHFFFFTKKNRKKDENYSSIIFFLIEFAFILLTFIALYFVKRNNVRLPEDYQILLLGIFFAWLLISLAIHKFKITPGENYIKTIFPFMRSEIILICFISFVLYFFKLATYSRLIILGSLGLFSFLELAVVSIYYLYSKPDVTDEVLSDFFHSDLIEDKSKEFQEEKREEQPTIYDFPGFSIKTFSIKEKLSRVYLKENLPLLEFISNLIDLERIDITESEVMETRNLSNTKILENESLALFFNQHKVNDFRRINEYFIQANKKLKSGGIFISKFESIAQRKERIYQKLPYVIAKISILIDFVVKRVWPKLPFLKKIYFVLSKGNNRALSMAECLGRLRFCGFERIGSKEIDDFVYFIGKKIEKPLEERTPSYGPIFKQKRVGKDSQILYVYKLRTMYPYSEYIQDYAYEENQLNNRGKIANDFRITAWGRILRKYYLDELPMIINVLKGDLKIYGVRPLSESFFNTYPEHLKKVRTKYKPGLIPPYYADLPQSIEEVWKSEQKYLERYDKKPTQTDFYYFFKSLNNIIFHGAKSE